MIPYLEVSDIHLGPFTLHVWGFMVALGILAGAATSARFARRRGLDPKIVWDMAPWILLGAFIGARAFHVLFYDPAYFFEHPLESIAFWKGGLSISFGQRRGPSWMRDTSA